MAGYRPYTLGSAEPQAAQAVYGGAHYHKRKKWWMRVAVLLLVLWR